MPELVDGIAGGVGGDVRVGELACYQVALPSTGGEYAMSGGRRYEEFVSTVVKVTADDGTCGFGEASTLGGTYLDGFPGSAQAAVRELAPVVLASDPLHAWPLVREMDRALVGHHPGKAAIDIAMWDLRARLLGVPVALLLGGIEQVSLDAFMAVRVGTAEAMASEARALAALGYDRLQIKVGDDPLDDIERVRAVFEAVGGELRHLWCDANAGWTTAEALRFTRAIADLDTYLEQPCSSMTELAQVRARSDTPIIMCEAAKQPRDLLDAVALGSVDGVNIKPVRVGGLTKAAVMRDIAQAARLMILVDEPMGGELAAAGIAQLGATVDPDLLLAASYLGDYDDSPTRAGGGEAGAVFSDGSITVPQGPGLGARLDENTLGEPVFVVRSVDV